MLRGETLLIEGRDIREEDDVDVNGE